MDHDQARAILGVADDATPDEIEAARRTLSESAGGNAPLRQAIDAAAAALAGTPADRRRRPSVLVVATFALAAVALVVVPVLFGTAAVICGLAAYRRGAPGARAAALCGSAAMTIGMAAHGLLSGRF